MIIVKKQFMYLRDYHDWRYTSFGNGRAFMDLNHFMLFERREEMTCELFKTKEKITTKDAKYIEIALEDFLQHSYIENEFLLCEYNTKANWMFSFIKLGLKVIRNAKIGIPTKETFPLIVRNEKFNFYIAGVIKIEKKKMVNEICLT